ncbi:MAG: DNRLRE domain-containing protein [Planctomycetota bacterium]|nr:DNRLRE domain-containing protein [Planctomycetota bacterium]
MRTFAGCISLLLAFALHGADDPIALEPSDDTFLSSEHTGKPAGRGEKDELQIYGRADAAMYRALVKFDLRQAPPGFAKAVLRLSCWNAHWPANATSFLRAHAITSSWNEGDASWDMATGAARWTHPGGDWNPQAAAAAWISGPIGGEKNRTLDLDLTALARVWQGNPNANQGVALMFEKGCTAEFRVRSRQFNGAGERPKLLLYYRAEAPTGAGWLKPQEIPPFEPLTPDAPVLQAPAPSGPLKLNEAFELRFSARGGKEPYLFGPAGPLPPGLQLGRDGVLKGKPSRAGSYVAGISCVGSDGKRSTDWFRWVVVDPAAPPPAAKTVAAKKTEAGNPPAPPLEGGKKTGGPERKTEQVVEEEER